MMTIFREEKITFNPHICTFNKSQAAVCPKQQNIMGIKLHFTSEKRIQNACNTIKYINKTIFVRKPFWKMCRNRRNEQFVANHHA